MKLNPYIIKALKAHKKGFLTYLRQDGSFLTMVVVSPKQKRRFYSLNVWEAMKYAALHPLSQLPVIERCKIAGKVTPSGITQPIT